MTAYFMWRTALLPVYLPPYLNKYEVPFPPLFAIVRIIVVAQPEYCTVCYSEVTVTSKPPSESENPGTPLLSVCEMSLDSDVCRDD